MSTNYQIFVDSTTDLTPALAEQWKLEVIPYIFILDGNEYYNYLDYRQLSVKEFYDALRAGKTGSTTQVTAHRYMEAWEPFLKEGKDILYMCLSSALSKSFEQSQLAAKEAMETYPDRKVITIDSKCASMGQGLLAKKAADARDEGKTLEDAAAYLENIIPSIHHWVMADDLHHLRRGGRVSGAQAFLGTMLSVKPILTILSEGKLTPVHKVRGRGKALDFFVEKMTEVGYNVPDAVFISHSDAPDLANQLKEMIEKKFGVKEFYINEIGPVIGAHTGPGTIAMMYTAKTPRA